MDASSFFFAISVAQAILPFALCAALIPLERAFPRSAGEAAGAPRLSTNVLLGVIALTVNWSAALWLMQRLGGFGAAWAPFNLAASDLPAPLKFVLAFLALDLMNYGVHVASHKAGFLWRLHRIHHSDTHVDGATGLRHHPLEGLVGFLLMTPLYGLLGLPLGVIAIYGAVSAAHAALSHANVALPPGLERILRNVVITPDAHRVHHSRERADFDRNYGQLFPFWDALFGTLKFRPAHELAKAPLGLAEMPGASQWPVLRLALSSFSKTSTTAPDPVKSTAAGARKSGPRRRG